MRRAAARAAARGSGSWSKVFQIATTSNVRADVSKCSRSPSCTMKPSDRANALTCGVGVGLAQLFAPFHRSAIHQPARSAADDAPRWRLRKSHPVDEALGWRARRQSPHVEL